MKVKICGITSVSDALSAAEAGADWIGLNFHPGSARKVEIGVAREIVAALPPSCEPVGLFVNRPAVEVAALAEWIGLKILQLHGSETVDDLRFLAGFRVVRAFRIADQSSLRDMLAFSRAAAEGGHPLHAVLVDAYVPGQFGGTGHSIDAALLASLDRIKPELPPLILAGGLTPENIADRAAIVKPWMVDVAGGVEQSPGVKDHARIAAFIRNVRESTSAGNPH